MRTISLLPVSLCVTWLVSSTARAAEPGVVEVSPPAPASAPDTAEAPRPLTSPSEVDRLSTFLAISAVEAHGVRRSVVVIGVTSGAVLVPTGIALWNRTDPVSRSIGVGMTIGGAVPLAFSMLSLMRSPMEQVNDTFDERRSTDLPPRELLSLTLNDWREAADQAHSRRILSGYVELGLGAAASAVGLGLLLTHSLPQVDIQKRQTIGSIFVGAGVPILALGIRSLYQPSTVESAWEKYRAAGGLPGPPSATPWSALDSTNVVLLPHGALVATAFPL